MKTAKVLSWIRTGQLAAVNHATAADGRPRWRIAPDALAAFDRSRSSKADLNPPPRRRAPRIQPAIEEFF